MTTTIETSKIPAHKKTTTELAIWLEGLSQGDIVYHTEYDNFRESAQHLRELYKPDCTWVKDEHDFFNTQCGDYFDLEQRRFCPSCGGAVKEVT